MLIHDLRRSGAYLPSYFGRTEAACVVRGNANCANKKKPSEYLKSQILADTMVFSDEGLRHLVAEMGVGQVVYGTDVPFKWPVTVDLVLAIPDALFEHRAVLSTREHVAFSEVHEVYQRQILPLSPPRGR